jgi:UDP-N-acetyl-D-mannosaminuronic acid dehydrogenase
MLGNWSFGDYFKKEAIAWAWELLTEVWGLDKTRLYATYFEGNPEQGLEPDHEARELWLTYLPPERVLPGHVLRELVQNDRIIGGMSPQCSAAAVELYKSFVEGNCLVTDVRTAEMCKLTENSFRDVNIAFANELSIVCEKFGIDVWELIRLANCHPRVNILKPGPGVGGHCIAVDPWFIVSAAPEEARLIRTARNVNESKPRWVLDRIRRAIADFLLANPTRSLSDMTVACLGLAFKPDIDDLRESPALHIAEELARTFQGRLLLVEPNIDELPASLADLRQVDLDSAMETADIVVLLVAHEPFQDLQARIRSDQVFLAVTSR